MWKIYLLLIFGDPVTLIHRYFIMTKLTLNDNELKALQHHLEHTIVDELDTFKTTNKEDNECWDKESSLSLAKKVGILN